MNKRGNVIVGILIILVIIILTSAGVLLLVQYGLLSVKAESEVSVLDTEFLPYGRSGTLTIKEFKFCSYVDDNFNCVGEGENFFLGNEVHFRFTVESSTFNGEVMLVENYRILGPNKEVLLEVEEKNNYHFDAKSKEEKESITFKDYFTVSEDLEEGEYTLELLVKNPLIEKKMKLVKVFQMEEYMGEH